MGEVGYRILSAFLALLITVVITIGTRSAMMQIMKQINWNVEKNQ